MRIFKESTEQRPVEEAIFAQASMRDTSVEIYEDNPQLCWNWDDIREAARAAGLEVSECCQWAPNCGKVECRLLNFTKVGLRPVR